MVSMRPDSEAITRIPVAKPKYAVVLLNAPLSITKPVKRIPDESVAIAYTISGGDVVLNRHQCSGGGSGQQRKAVFLFSFETDLAGG